jgi:dipeptide/tripeptide permease
MKPVITGTVVRTSPEGRQDEGFAIFYRMINAGSVTGKTLAYGVRVVVSIRHVLITSVVGSLAALGLAAFAYVEPERGKSTPEPLGKLLSGYGTALKNARFAVALVVFAGFYFMAEQFYMTFPKYVTRHIDKNAPLELITLINPALIALFQGVVLRATRRLHPVTGMIIGMLLGSASMLVMGVVPGMLGACASGAIFAFCEMNFSPRFYDYLASFAPSGKAGMYMGLAFVPFAIGAWVGGQASGRLIAAYLPETGERHPTLVWSIYAALGLGFALAMLVYRRFAVPRTAAA